jgi:tetratricopeptide (TPR) repeat protein
MKCAFIFIAVRAFAAAAEENILATAVEYAQQHQYDKAEALFQQALTTSGVSQEVEAWLQVNLGGIHFVQGNWTQAEAFYRKAYIYYEQFITGRVMNHSDLSDGWHQSFIALQTNLGATMRQQNQFVRREVWDRRTWIQEACSSFSWARIVALICVQSAESTSGQMQMLIAGQGLWLRQTLKFTAS